MAGPDLDPRIETYYVRVRGIVQGVGFRHATVRQAHALGIRGWVANLDDGSVEAMLQGSANQVDRMLSWLRHGPPAARVTRSGRRGARSPKSVTSASSSTERRRNARAAPHVDACRLSLRLRPHEVTACAYAPPASSPRTPIASRPTDGCTRSRRRRRSRGPLRRDICGCSRSRSFRLP